MICRNQRMKANAEKVELREQHFLSLTPMNSIVILNEQRAGRAPCLFRAPETSKI